MPPATAAVRERYLTALLAGGDGAAGWLVDYLPPPTPEGVTVGHVRAVAPAVVAISTTLATPLPGTAQIAPRRPRRC